MMYFNRYPGDSDGSGQWLHFKNTYSGLKFPVPATPVSKQELLPFSQQAQVWGILIMFYKSIGITCYKFLGVRKLDLVLVFVLFLPLGYVILTN